MCCSSRLVPRTTTPIQPIQVQVVHRPPPTPRPPLRRIISPADQHKPMPSVPSKAAEPTIGTTSTYALSSYAATMALISKDILTAEENKKRRRRRRNKSKSKGTQPTTTTGTDSANKNNKEDPMISIASSRMHNLTILDDNNNTPATLMDAPSTTFFTTWSSILNDESQLDDLMLPTTTLTSTQPCCYHVDTTITTALNILGHNNNNERGLVSSLKELHIYEHTNEKYDTHPQQPPPMVPYYIGDEKVDHYIGCTENSDVRMASTTMSDYPNKNNKRSIVHTNENINGNHFNNFNGSSNPCGRSRRRVMVRSKKMYNGLDTLLLLPSS